MEIIDYVYSFTAIGVFAYAVYRVAKHFKDKDERKNIGGGRDGGSSRRR